MSFSLSGGNLAVSTPPQDKTGKTSIYLDLSGSKFAGTIRVFIFGTLPNGDLKLCTNRGNYFEVAANKKYILYNSVFEDGCRSCFLQFERNTTGDVVAGVWEANSTNDSRGELLARGKTLDSGRPDVSNHELGAYKKSDGVWETAPLDKVTSSSIYLALFSAGSAESVKVQIIGTRDGHEENCTNRTDSFTVTCGNKHMMCNLVYEKGYRTAFLRFLCQDQPMGQWSADSIPESGCIKHTGREGYTGAKNTKDEGFRVTNENRSTNVRDKGTNTSVYLNLTKASFPGTVKVAVFGCNGNDQKNCTNRGEYFEVQAGKKYMLFNTVNESGFKAARLEFLDPNGRTIEGVWSPDSSPENGCIVLRGGGARSDGQSKNTSDTAFRFEGAGTFDTEIRWKGTNSSVYVNLTESKFQGTVQVSVIGISSGREENCTNRCASFSLSAGQKYALYNMVKERGHNDALLRFTVASSQLVVGKWSPDYAQEAGVTTVTGKEGETCPICRDLSHVTKLIKVPYVNQLGVPAGCESASAVMLLQHYGIQVSLREFIEKYLDVRPWTIKDGKKFAGDPNTVFVGDPYIKSGLNCGYGCYAPCLAVALNKVLGLRYRAYAETGRDLPSVISEYIDKGRPVLIWATMNMTPMRISDSWTIDYPPSKAGQTFQWKGGEHCLLLAGYDSENYYFNDPYQNNGVCGFKRSVVEQRYNELGKQLLKIGDWPMPKPNLTQYQNTYEEIQKKALELQQNLVRAVIPNSTIQHGKPLVIELPPIAQITITASHAIQGDGGAVSGSISVKDGKITPGGITVAAKGGSFKLGFDKETQKAKCSGNLTLGPSWGNLSFDLGPFAKDKTLDALLNKITMSIGDGSFKTSYDFVKQAYIIQVTLKVPAPAQKYSATVTFEIKLLPRGPWSHQGAAVSREAVMVLTGIGLGVLLVVGGVCAAPAVGAAIGAGATAAGAIVVDTAALFGAAEAAAGAAACIGIATVTNNLFSGLPAPQ